MGTPNPFKYGKNMNITEEKSLLCHFIPDESSNEKWLSEIVSPRPGVFSCRGDFYHFEINTNAITNVALRDGLSKKLISAFKFSRWATNCLNEAFGQALGIDCRDGKVTMFSICKWWGASASQKIRPAPEFNAIFHRDQGKLIIRFWERFHSIVITMQDGFVEFRGGSDKGEGLLRVRSMNGLNFFPSGLIHRGDFYCLVPDLEMTKLPKKSIFSTLDGIKLNGKTINGSNAIEKIEKKFDGHLVSRFYNITTDSGAMLSYSSSSDPISFSWLEDRGLVDCVFVC